MKDEPQSYYLTDAFKKRSMPRSLLRSAKSQRPITDLPLFAAAVREEQVELPLDHDPAFNRCLKDAR